MATERKSSKSGEGKAKQLFLGLVFGIIFGFILQKGGVAKFHILIGQLLLKDFTVVKVMLTAVVVGMLGIHLMYHLKMVELHIKPTRIASNIIGGLFFGAGFALSAYCPGTGAAALGQGNLDAVAMIAGMILGSYVFAEASGWIGRKIDPIGDKGKITLLDVLPMNRGVIVIGSAAILAVVLAVIEFTAVR
ncbi:MAG TPA: YeeE/YedE thiosulfate transporter family protein [Planctomycetaceae bacterium]|nr:YeeE/YedE thiosulfate transporter family protein [Planctomycetaceae bacterium]HQZ66237.1 YeeE/YedE thiosulfate transporter family protein [Planctomycetaceae bacterium]HRA87892.1 YeeE/YedE thiosulfate transporter family protein [Planctomycetaceae bacterium]